ncbi:MAG: hypothetical protein AAGJ37_11440 [Pseudomonadota bacterium]
MLAQISPAVAVEKKTDPTKPPSVIVEQLVEEIKPKSAMELTAVFKRKNKLYAVINGKLFSAGEYLDGVNDDMKVEDISEGTVVLRSIGQDGRLTELSVDDEAQIIKQVVK